jgi:hypothetical protein
VVHTRSSAGHTARFKELARRMIPMDNRTRWNSWYDMLIVLLNVRPAVEKYCADFEEELEEDILNHSDWRKLRTIKDFLGPFTRATLATEGDSTSIDSTLFTMDVLIKHLSNQIVSNLFFLFFKNLKLIIIGCLQSKKGRRKQGLPCSS